MGVLALKTLEGVFVAKMFVSDEVAAKLARRGIHTYEVEQLPKNGALSIGTLVPQSRCSTIEGGEAVESVMPHDPYDDMGPDPMRDLSDLEPVEVAPDYHVELGVPFTSEQLMEVSRIARERGISPGRAVQDLVEQALAARHRRS